MERELKDKNSLIKSLHNKLDSQGYELDRLTEVIQAEKSNTFKVEISQLNRKIKEKEKVYEKAIMTYDSVINNLKSQIQNLTHHNDACIVKIEELEIFNSDLHRKIYEYEHESKELVEGFANKSHIIEEIIKRLNDFNFDFNKLSNCSLAVTNISDMLFSNEKEMKENEERRKIESNEKYMKSINSSYIENEYASKAQQSKYNENDKELSQVNNLYFDYTSSNYNSINDRRYYNDKQTI